MTLDLVVLRRERAHLAYVCDVIPGSKLSSALADAAVASNGEQHLHSQKP